MRKLLISAAALAMTALAVPATSTPALAQQSTERVCPPGEEGFRLRSAELPSDVRPTLRNLLIKAWGEDEADALIRVNRLDGNRLYNRRNGEVAHICGIRVASVIMRVRLGRT